jgi:hypothetical protein
MIAENFDRAPTEAFGFNPNMIAPSLSSVKLDDFTDPDESWLMQDDKYFETPDKSTGLNPLQVRKLRDRAEDDFKRADSYWERHYADMRKDWEFYGGRDQWTEEAKLQRQGRPILTIPILGKFVKRIVAETKKNPPSVKLNPREDSDVNKAEIGMGLVRYIEDVSGAKYAYSHGLECAAVGGIGWIKGKMDLKRHTLRIEKVKDAFRYYMDPDAEREDGSDARYFISRFKKTKNRDITWCYEYWWKEWLEDEQSDGVFWALIDGADVVDYGRFPGEIIPIFPVIGEDVVYEGERVVKGIVRDMQDSQRIYNYLKSQEVETIALTPKAPIMAEEGTIPKEYEHDWNNCTKNPTKVLKYRATNLDGEPTKNKPEFMAMKADTQWMREAAVGAINDLKEVTGIYDTALGSDSKELSGKAIIAKQITADAGQFTYTEHLQMTIQQVGRWLMQTIPYVYAQERVIRILGEDGKLRSVNLDAPMGDNTPDELQVPIDLDFSEMDISVGSGNSYATRREAGVDAFQSIMQAIPNTATAIADLAVKNMDIPWANEAAERLHAMLPPEIKAAEKAPKGFVPAAQLQQAMEMFEQTKQANTELQQQMQARIVALEGELKNQIQGRIAAERIKGEYGLAETQIKEFNANQREAMKVQADVEKTASKTQTELIKEVGKRAIETARATAGVFAPGTTSSRNIPGMTERKPQAGTMDRTAPNLSFKNATLNDDELSQTDMLMNLK